MQSNLTLFHCAESLFPAWFTRVCVSHSDPAIVHPGIDSLILQIESQMHACAEKHKWQDSVGDRKLIFFKHFRDARVRSPTWNRPLSGAPFATSGQRGNSERIAGRVETLVSKIHSALHLAAAVSLVFGLDRTIQCYNLNFLPQSGPVHINLHNPHVEGQNIFVSFRQKLSKAHFIIHWKGRAAGFCPHLTIFVHLESIPLSSHSSSVHIDWQSNLPI
jgi:hypothetical protein